MNMIRTLRRRVIESPDGATLTAAEYEQLQAEWITRTRMNWQPMNTAPKELGSDVLIAADSDEGTPTVGHAFLGRDEQWYWMDADPGYHDPITESNGKLLGWQPLPEPPKPSEVKR